MRQPHFVTRTGQLIPFTEASDEALAHCTGSGPHMWRSEPGDLPGAMDIAKSIAWQIRAEREMEALAGAGGFR